jgi:teichoic acid transport system permease protein
VTADSSDSAGAAGTGAMVALQDGATETTPPKDGGRPESATPRRAPVRHLEHHVFGSRKSGMPKLRQYFPELWQRRQFVYEMARSTLRGQNYLNVFGQLWLILNPLLMGSVYFVLVDILSNGKHASNYFAMLLAGLFIFTFFSGTLSQSSGSIIGSARLIMNSSFPRLLLPITQLVIAFMRFLPSMAVFLVVHTLEGLPWGWNACYALPAFVEVVLFGSGLGYLCATAQVYFRDFASFLPYLTRIWLFLSPVLWNLQTELDSHSMKAKIIAINPLAPMIGSWGDALVYNTTPRLAWLLEGGAWAIAAFIVGCLVFIWREREFSIRL